MARVSPLKKSLRDMLLSMAVISLPIVAIVEWFPHDSKKPEDAVQTVDYSIPLAQARRDPDLPFQAMAPAGAPRGLARDLGPRRLRPRRAAPLGARLPDVRRPVRRPGPVPAARAWTESWPCRLRTPLR